MCVSVSLSPFRPLSLSYCSIYEPFLNGGVCCSLLALYPVLQVTALRYDPENKYTSFSAFAGMFVMAFSLSLFVGK